jgi:hypothetical protein
MKANYFKIGDVVSWNNGKVTIEEIYCDTSVCDSRDEYEPNEENLTNHPTLFIAMVRNQRNHSFEVEYCDLEVIRHIEDLTKEELTKLRKEICIGSIYFDDYNNSFGIDKYELSNWCDEYINYLFYLCGSKSVELSTAYEKDTIETFVEFMMNKEDLCVCGDDFENL